MIFELKYAHLSTRKFRVDQWVANIHLLYMPLVGKQKYIWLLLCPSNDTAFISLKLKKMKKHLYSCCYERFSYMCVAIDQQSRITTTNTLPNRSRMRIEKGCEHFKRWTIWYNTVIVLTLLLMLMWELPPTKSKHIILRFCYLHIPSTNLILTKSIIVFVHSNNTNKKEISRGFQQ